MLFFQPIRSNRNPAYVESEYSLALQLAPVVPSLYLLAAFLYYLFSIRPADVTSPFYFKTVVSQRKDFNWPTKSSQPITAQV